MRFRSLGALAIVGYAADIAVGAVAYWLGGVGALVVAAHLVNILVLFLAVAAGVRAFVRLIRRRRHGAQRRLGRMQDRIAAPGRAALADPRGRP